jgi:hypothetical protein
MVEEEAESIASGSPGTHVVPWMVGVPYHPPNPSNVAISPMMIAAGATVINVDCEQDWIWSRHVARRVYLAMLGAQQAEETSDSPSGLGP